MLAGTLWPWLGFTAFVLLMLLPSSFLLAICLKNHSALITFLSSYCSFQASRYPQPINIASSSGASWER